MYDCCYRPQTKLREGNVFTGVCDSIQGGVPGPGEGGSGPGGMPALGGGLVRGGLPGGDILLECILV